MVLRLRLPAPDWRKGKCLGQADGPEYDPWFDNEDYGYENQQDLGREICNGAHDGAVCPIREQCLIFALTNNERFGVWGGTSEADRRATRKMWPWPGGAEPHDDWTWHPPGHVAELLKQRGVPDVEEGEDDEDD